MSQSIAFIFPGQGRIPDALPPESKRVASLLDRAEEHGLALRTWIAEGRRDLLEQTENAQPALFLDSQARDEQLRDVGWAPQAVAGHSLGEYGALVCSGVLTPIDALEAVIARGRAMRGVEGTMSAILKLELGVVEELCREIGDGVCIANHNGPTQVVVSGEAGAVGTLAEKAQTLGGRSIPLQVSGPFHSPFMLPAQGELEPTLRALAFMPPSIAMVSSVTATQLEAPGELKETLCRQITSPVRWVDTITRLEALGISTAIEVGSGDVLTRLGRRMSTRLRFMTYEEAIDERD